VCLILFAYRLHRQRPLVVAANRDEFYARPARAAHWWNDTESRIFGGRDLEARGTWLAVSGNGNLAAVTNWTEEARSPKPPASRGDLPMRFLNGSENARDFAESIDGDSYAGFNLLAYDGDELVYHSNRTGEVRALDAGVYGLTNTRLGPSLVLREDGAVAFRTVGATHPRTYEQWPKAVFGAAALARAARHATANDLIDLLAEPHVPMETPPDREQVPERAYSPCFIHGKEYGTRASTAVIFGRHSLEFAERQYGPLGKPGSYSATRIRFGP